MKNFSVTSLMRVLEKRGGIKSSSSRDIGDVHLPSRMAAVMEDDEFNNEEEEEVVEENDNLKNNHYFQLPPSSSSSSSFSQEIFLDKILLLCQLDSPSSIKERIFISRLLFIHLHLDFKRFALAKAAFPSLALQIGSLGLSSRSGQQNSLNQVQQKSVRLVEAATTFNAYAQEFVGLFQFLLNMNKLRKKLVEKAEEFPKNEKGESLFKVEWPIIFPYCGGWNMGEALEKLEKVAKKGKEEMMMMMMKRRRREELEEEEEIEEGA